VRSGSYRARELNFLTGASFDLSEAQLDLLKVTCTVSYCDLKGVHHVIEVTADSLYEAVAQGLRFREHDWIDEVGHLGVASRHGI
jgi:hypothetical protein